MKKVVFLKLNQITFGKKWNKGTRRKKNIYPEIIPLGNTVRNWP
jgi:hypothetical protein